MMVLFSDEQKGYFSIELVELLLKNNRFTISEEGGYYDVWIGGANGRGLTLSAAICNAQEALKNVMEERLDKAAKNQKIYQDKYNSLTEIKELL